MNDDLIRRSDLREAVCEICYSCGRETEVEGGVLIDLVDKLPAVDAEPVRHGRWIPVMHRDIFGKEFVCRHACSKCNEYALCECANYDSEEVLSNYCHSCGAKMYAEVHDDA